MELTVRLTALSAWSSSTDRVSSRVRASQFLEQPHVLDGDDRLVGEGGHQLDLLVGEGPHLRPADHEDAADRALPEHGNGEDRPDLGAALAFGPAVLGIGHGVVDVDDASLEEGPARRRLPAGTVRVSLHDVDELGGLPVRDRHAIDVPFLAVDEPLVRAAEPHRALDEARQHRLEVEGRAADDLEDLAGRRLLLERLGEVVVARLELREEADVLDGDDGLVGEGLEQLDLAARRSATACARVTRSRRWAARPGASGRRGWLRQPAACASLGAIDTRGRPGRPGRGRSSGSRMARPSAAGGSARLGNARRSGFDPRRVGQSW